MALAPPAESNAVMTNDNFYASDKSAPQDRSTGGPLDLSEVNAVSQYLDFGSIRIAARDGLQIRLEIDEATNSVVAVSLEISGSTLQLQAFAAPRSEGVWHEVRANMQNAILAQGGETQERVGSLGPELLAKIPLLDEKGIAAGFKLARFIGVDGPKWFLRGVVGGAALQDPKAAGDVDALFRSVVVVRGDDPLPPKEQLKLTVPGGTVAPPRVI